MAVSKKNRLQVGFTRLGITLGAVSIPVIWLSFYFSINNFSPNGIIKMTAFSVVCGVGGGLVVRFVPVWIVGVTIWVRDGFTSAESKDNPSLPPKEEER